MGEYIKNDIMPYDKNMDKLKLAEEIMKKMSIEKSAKNKITTNQMRIILSTFINVRNKLEKNSMNNELTEEEKYEIKYIKIKLIYQAGRMEKKQFLNNTHLTEMIDDVNNREEFKKILDYVEALVAFQKYYVEK